MVVPHIIKLLLVLSNYRHITGSRASAILVEQRTHSGLDCPEPTSYFATHFRSIGEEYAGPLEPGGSRADW